MVPSEETEPMETLASKLQETRQHVTHQGDALVTRARDAGESFVSETRGAGRDFAGLLGHEARRWRRYIARRAALLQHEVRDVLSLPTLERRVLLRVDGTLRTLDARVRERLAALGPKPTRKRSGTN
jgi:hypothetical protein